VRRVALDLLSRREHSAAELRAKLRAREFAYEDIDAALVRLAAEGLQSDARFVDAFVTSHRNRGQGPVRIRHDLEQRGIDAEAIAAALAAAEPDWVSLARAARIKRFGAVAPRDFRERGRQARFLAQRGFTAGQARAALGDDDDA
jgi:regulatory protein